MTVPADSSSTNLALIAIVGSVITALFKLLGNNTKATDKNSTAINALVKETRKGNKESADRNGHLGEQSLHLADLVSTGNKLTTKMVERLEKTAIIAAEDRDKLINPHQHIDTQEVEHQIVKDKEVS